VLFHGLMSVDFADPTQGQRWLQGGAAYELHHLSPPLNVFALVNSCGAHTCIVIATASYSTALISGSDKLRSCSEAEVLFFPFQH
jgi:hypothetical protein